jgi:hypothetical protein
LQEGSVWHGIRRPGCGLRGRVRRNCKKKGLYWKLAVKNLVFLLKVVSLQAASSLE